MNCIRFTNVYTMKKKNGLNTKNKRKFDYKKLRLADDYECESEEEDKKTK